MFLLNQKYTTFINCIDLTFHNVVIECVISKQRPLMVFMGIWTKSTYNITPLKPFKRAYIFVEVSAVTATCFQGKRPYFF